MPRLPRKKEEIEGVREKILDKALDVISREGYESLTMRRLGSLLGCAAKTIYNYYEGKEEIYLHILIRGFRTLNSDADEALNGIEDPLEKLRALCNAYINFGLKNIHYYNIMFNYDVPKYLNYLDTHFEPVAREEKETAMYYAVISEAAISEILTEKTLDHKGINLREESAFILVRMWSMLHGYVSLHNSGSFREYHSNTLKFQNRIVDNLLKDLE